MTPYTVTTKRRVRLPEDKGDELGRQEVSHVAAVTLDEARAIAWKAAYAVLSGGDGSEFLDSEFLAPERATRDTSWLVTARELGEQGGTVGPLPDGTVIDVKPVDLSTSQAYRVFEDSAAMPGNERAMLDALAQLWVEAYNAGKEL